ncbi:MAG TPA: hypothetical protein VGM92_08770 [Candidatus Kapabacteria bacterium]
MTHILPIGDSEAHALNTTGSCGVRVDEIIVIHGAFDGKPVNNPFLREWIGFEWCGGKLSAHSKLDYSDGEPPHVRDILSDDGTCIIAS